MPSKCLFEANLACALEDSRLVRELMRDRGTLLVWSSAETTGLPTLAAIALNGRVMELFAEVFCSAAPRPKAPPIAWIRNEVLGDGTVDFI